MIRIRLQRKGRRKRPIYHLVVADSRAARDGRIIEQVGRYDNVTESKEVVLNEDRILYWLETGAQPSDTVRKILRNSGLLYKRHLMMWGKTEEEIEAAMAEWKSYRDSKDGSDASRKDTHKSVLDAEEKKFKKQAEQEAADAAKELAAKKAKEEEISKAADAPEAKEPAKTEVAEKPKEEEPKAEKPEAVAETKEAKVAEESVAKEPAKAEVVEEAKKEEPKAEKPKAAAETEEEKATEEPVAEEPAKAEVVEETKEEEPKAEKPEAATEVKEEKAADASQTSADMTAKDAIDHIKNTDLADLKGFVAEDEARVTVLSAWESKQSDN